MMWQPSTYGEDLFLRLHEGLGRQVVVTGARDTGLDLLVSPDRFSEFTGLTATLEVFLRCLRSAKEFFETEGHLPATDIGGALRNAADLPLSPNV